MFYYFLTPGNLMTDCRSAVIAVTISYPRSLIACRHGWIRGGGSPAIPYPYCRFAGIYGAAKKYARALRQRPTGNILMSRALSLSLPFSPFLAPSPLYGENLTFKLITQLLPLSCRKTRNSLCRSSVASLLLFLSFSPPTSDFPGLASCIFSTLIQAPAFLASR